MFNLDFNKPCHVHFMGIGGISMSGLAEVLLNRGFTVSGSDNTPSAITARLSEKGAAVVFPQKAENITDDIDLVVYTAAIRPDNPEYRACEEKKLPMMTRAQFLGALMRLYPESVAVAGTHGKTTTTGMIGEILLAAGRAGALPVGPGTSRQDAGASEQDTGAPGQNAGVPGQNAEALGQNAGVPDQSSGTSGVSAADVAESDPDFAVDRKPTISIGGILPSIASNICVGNSEVFLTEACEYTNSYHDFYPKYNVILNIEEDHMDFFKDLEDIRKSFTRYAQNTAANGVLAIHGGIPDRDEITKGLTCRVITFGAEGSDYTAENIRVEGGRTAFSIVEKGVNIGEARLAVPGTHNVGNALAAIAIGREMGIPLSIITKALEGFGGTERRFQFRGEVNGARLYDDYAHHPTEIAATIAAARSLPHSRLVVVFQPHTYTRTKAFLDEFAEALSGADIVGLVPVYPAREKDIYGVHSEDIAERIEKRIGKCHLFADFDEAENFLKNISSTGDLLITMGAGDIVKIADSLSSK